MLHVRQSGALQSQILKNKGCSHFTWSHSTSFVRYCSKILHKKVCLLAEGQVELPLVAVSILLVKKYWFQRLFRMTRVVFHGILKLHIRIQHVIAINSFGTSSPNESHFGVFKEDQKSLAGMDCKVMLILIMKGRNDELWNYASVHHMWCTCVLKGLDEGWDFCTRYGVLMMGLIPVLYVTREKYPRGWRVLGLWANCNSFPFCLRRLWKCQSKAHYSYLKLPVPDFLFEDILLILFQ